MDKVSTTPNHAHPPSVLVVCSAVFAFRFTQVPTRKPVP